MSIPSDEHAKTIVELETALLLPLPDAARREIEARLRELRAAPTIIAPHAARDVNIATQQTVQSTTGTISNQGRIDGVAVGVNLGTIQAFFGVQPPADAKELLDNYLDSLVAEYGRLRLGKLLGKEQTGHDQAVVPALSLRAVYTSLATTARIREADFRLDREALQKTLRAGDPARVLPDQTRLAVFDMPQARGLPAPMRAGASAIAAALLADQWQASWRTATEARDRQTAIVGYWLRPELSVEAVAAHPRLVLLGDPGSGKSTVLRYLIVSLAEALLAGRAAGIDLRGWEKVAPLPVPLFCQLGRVAKALDDDPEHDLDVLVEVLLRPVVAAGGLRQELRRTILQTWRKGDALLCLDGLDEVSGAPEAAGAPSRRERVAEAIRNLADQLGHARIVVTCRTRPYQLDAAWQLREPWAIRTLEPFAFGQVHHFVAAWYAQAATGSQPKYTPAEARSRAEQLIDVLERSTALQDLTTSPLLLTMLTLLHFNKKQLPQERADIYEELVELLLDRWEGVRSANVGRRIESIGERLGLPRLSPSELRPLIHEIAFEVHRQAVDGRGVLSGEVMRKLFDAFFARKINPAAPGEVTRAQKADKTDRFVDLLREEAGLLQEEGDDHYVLPHLTFQEYLAACHLARRENNVLAYAEWCATGEHWREPLLLLMGRLHRQEKFLQASNWLDLLVAERCGTKPKSAEQHQRDALLAVDCYCAQEWREHLDSCGYDVVHFEDRLRKALVDLLECPAPAMLLQQRIEAGDALNRLSDPRFPLTEENWKAEQCNERFGAPVGYWCYVRPGAYCIGGWEIGERAVTITLPAFWIARFPITVAQYRSFIDVGYGPGAERWWTTNGWRWKQERTHSRPWRWSEAPYASPKNQPVTGVTWYEATAFCAWQTERLASVLPAGYLVRLPTEAEWEVAAAYDVRFVRHNYPWGDAMPTSQRAIYDQSNLKAPVPVGCCAAGAAACGAFDMSGNAWEWMASNHKNYPGQSNLAAENPVVGYPDIPIRGGSFRSRSSRICCAARHRRDPNDISNHFGFRLVLAPRRAS